MAGGSVRALRCRLVRETRLLEILRSLGNYVRNTLVEMVPRMMTESIYPHVHIGLSVWVTSKLKCLFSEVEIIKCTLVMFNSILIFAITGSII